MLIPLATSLVRPSQNQRAYLANEHCCHRKIRSHAHCKTASQIATPAGESETHVASTLPGHVRCCLCLTLYLSRLRGPERVCVHLASRTCQLRHPRDHALFPERHTRADSHCP